MIHIGVFEWPKTVSAGDFTCPKCESQQAYRLRVSRNFLTLYFIPVIPISRLWESVQCRRCRIAFPPEVLAGSPPEPPPPKTPPLDQAPFPSQLAMAIAAIITDDGRVTTEEIEAGCKVYAIFVAEAIPAEVLHRYCDLGFQRGITSRTYIEANYQQWDYNQRMIILQAMFYVASVSDKLSRLRHQTLLHCQELFGLNEQEYRECIERMIDL